MCISTVFFNSVLDGTLLIVVDISLFNYYFRTIFFNALPNKKYTTKPFLRAAEYTGVHTENLHPASFFALCLFPFVFLIYATQEAESLE